MSTLTLEQVRANLDESLEHACSQHEPLIIQREGKDSLVVMRAKDIHLLADDPGMAETLYLLSDPRNARELMQSIEDANNGKLIYPDPAIFDEL